MPNGVVCLARDFVVLQGYNVPGFARAVCRAGKGIAYASEVVCARKDVGHTLGRQVLRLLQLL
jgi:hypothetical protein